MRLATIRLEGSTAAARVENGLYYVLPYSDVRSVLESSGDWRKTAETDIGLVLDEHQVDLAPVVPNPEKIICVGLNYQDHAAETGQVIPEFPTLFAKYSRSLIGAFDELVLPDASDAVDWEIELGIVVGRQVRSAPPEKSWDAIAGYTVVNDVSMRDWQVRTSQYLQGKTFESSTPIGPHLVSPDEIDHARDLEVRCDVDGDVVQKSSTSKLIFNPAEIVSYISQFITLVPGDVIATGTPGGIGAARNPARFLEAGQRLTSTIDGIGSLSNPCTRNIGHNRKV